MTELHRRIGRWTATPRFAVTSVLRQIGPWMVLVALVSWLLAGCRALSTQDVDLIRQGRAVNAAHAADVRLPTEAREIAQDAYDAFCVLDFSATGTQIPDDVRARIAKGGPER